MSETNLPVSEDNSVPLERPSPDSAGSMLRVARERAGFHVAALAVAIKIPVKKLEALEADQLLGTHDLVFTRALASSVCRTLKIDPTPVLAALPQTVVPELHVDSNGINAPFTPRGVGQSRSVNEIITQPWVMLVIALCAGTAVMAATNFWGRKDAQNIAMGTAPAPEEVVAPQTMTPVVIPAPAVTEPTPEEKTVASSTASLQVSTSTSASASMAVTPPATSGAAGSAAPPSQSTTAASNMVEAKSATVVGTSIAPVFDAVMGIKARQQSVWVKVVDAKGDVRLSRIVAAGERVECGGVLPLTVILGRADSVDVEVRGKPFDFSGFTRENVARFEVK